MPSIIADNACEVSRAKHINDVLAATAGGPPHARDAIDATAERMRTVPQTVREYVESGMDDQDRFDGRDPNDAEQWR